MKAPFPANNTLRRDEDVATDKIYSRTPAIDGGELGAQIFVGRKTLVSDVYPLKSEKDFPGTLEDNVRERGAMNKLISDRATSTYSQRTLDFLRYLIIGLWQSEPYHQQQNPAEHRIQHVKKTTNAVMDRTGTPPNLWLQCLQYVCFLLNNVAFESLKWKTPLFSLTGQRNDISMLLCFIWYQPVYYKVYEGSFPDTKEARGRFVGISEHVGHSMTFKILTDDTRKIIHRSEIRAANDDKSPNLRLDDIFDGKEAHEFVTRMRDLVTKLKPPGSTTTEVPTSETTAEPTETTSPAPFVPASLIGRTFLMDENEDGERHRAQIIDVVDAVEQQENDFARDPNALKFRVEINDAQYEELLSMNDILYYIERRENNSEAPEWRYTKIVAHSGPLIQTDPDYRGSRWNVMVECTDGSTKTMPLTTLAADDPVPCALYAREHDLLDEPGWKRFKGIAQREQKLLRLAKQAKLRSYRTATKYMYGYEIPRDYQHAVELDRKFGNTNWQDATKLEMAQLDEYKAFTDTGHKRDVGPPTGYKKIRVHLIFAVKHDGRHKARLVADGHLTDIPVESVYSGVVSLRGLRLVIFLAELNDLEIWATDIGNAYLEALTTETVYIIAGPEFGDLEGHILVIYKALYGLRSSGKRWGERLADCLLEMGFTPCRSDPSIWMRPCGDHYEYIAAYVDDLAIASRNPKAITDELEDTYQFKLKGTGAITFHLGCDFFRDDEGILCMAPKTYIDKMIGTYERLFGSKPPRKYRSPLEKGDNPEMDVSTYLEEDDIQKYQSMVGSMQWAVSLGRFDIATAVMTLSGFRAAPRVGHLDRCKRVYGYLLQFRDATIRFRTEEPDYSNLPDQDYDWMYSVYGDMEEQIPHDRPPALGKYVTLTHFVDANLYHCKLTGRSVTGILDFINQTPADWYSKKQATVETATYGSEFVSSRTCVDRHIDLRQSLYYLGVPVRKKAYMFGDNESVVNSSSTPHAKLHKRHNALSFHRVREIIASKILGYYHVRSEQNPSDILSKHWGYQQVWPLLQCVLFWQGDTLDLLAQDKSSQLQGSDKSNTGTTPTTPVRD